MTLRHGTLADTNISEAEDFYPYGAIRIDTRSTAHASEKRKYAGTEYDALS
jgi:hypothetical protein